MKAIETMSSNHNFGPPKSVTFGSIVDLPCQILEDDGSEIVRSVWQPSEEERAAIAAGANIALDVVWHLLRNGFVQCRRCWYREWLFGCLTFARSSR